MPATKTMHGDDDDADDDDDGDDDLAFFLPVTGRPRGITEADLNAA